MPDWSTQPGDTRDEFAPGVFVRPGIPRRDIFRLLGASVALGALAGCRRPPPENIVPHAHEPAAFTPGVPQQYATSLTRRGFGMGALVLSDDGRPTKIEGNPLHPASLGASDAIMQAELLTLYDPARSASVRGPGGVLSDWDAFERALLDRSWAKNGGRGLHVVTGAITSPTAVRLLERLAERLPHARFYTHEPLTPARARAGAFAAFGRELDAILDLGSAGGVACLDADLFGPSPSGVRYAMDFARARRAGRERAALSPALLVAEPAPTPTGIRADHRLAVRRSHVPSLAAALAAAVGVEGVRSESPLSPPERKWVREAAAALRAGPPGVVAVGEAQDAVVHELAHRTNAAVGSLNRAARLIDPPDRAPLHGTLAECSGALASGKVDTLLLVGVNPLDDTPADAGFVEAVGRAALSFHIGLYRDETASVCSWNAPLAHDLESWGDCRAFDGTAAVIQPLTQPMGNGRTLLWLLGRLLGESATDRQMVEQTWRARLPGDFADAWRATLRSGVVAGTSSAPVDAPVLNRAISIPPSDAAGIEVVINPHHSLLDGRYAHNAWLQELPDPLTQQTWGNAAVLSPSLADRLNVRSGDALRISHDGASVELPAIRTPGVAEGVLALTLGGGRSAAVPWPGGEGVSVRPLRRAGRGWLVTGVDAQRTGASLPLALAQLHGDQEGRDIVRVSRPGEPGKPRKSDVHLSLYTPTKPSAAQQWGMTIDLAACTGCGACIVACQAENNVPSVGPDEVRRGRRMHWIRVDRYFDQDRVLVQPLACVHCESAPCELVCPTGATQHSQDGLNEMNYARCIGTRYCSNNCPYKVRRFNFFRYAPEGPSYERMRNPRVTTRGRGVMEKCTYCVQRIRTAGFDAHAKGAPVPDGAVTPACAQACPSRAIVFGDVSDPSTRVSVERASPRAYALLGELNTAPRTLYLADLRPEQSGAVP